MDRRREGEGSADGWITFPPFRLDRLGQRLWHGERSVPLAPKAYAVLQCLLERPGQLVAREELLARIWGDVHLSEGVIKTQIAANGNLFPIEDALNGEHLKLAYDGVDFTRTLEGYGFFPDVKFHDPKDPQKKYLIDFWVVPKAGALAIAETRIYQSPQQVDGQWRSVARQPVPWWWIPASEHPGKMAEKRGWEVMSAVEENALKGVGSDGIYKLKDDKTGQTLDLKFIDAHQPVRKLDNGEYFACSDFRAAGTKDQIYDVDFWVKEQDGKMVVNQVRVHKVPEMKNGQWVQIPRYSFKDLGKEALRIWTRRYGRNA